MEQTETPNQSPPISQPDNGDDASQRQRHRSIIQLSYRIHSRSFSTSFGTVYFHYILTARAIEEGERLIQF